MASTTRRSCHSSARAGVPLILSTAATAEMLGVAQNTLRAWRAQGVGPAPVRRPSGRTLGYRPADIDAWLDAQVKGGGAR